MHPRTKRSVLAVAAVAIAMLAPKLSCLAASRSEVRVPVSTWRVERGGEWREGKLHEETGVYRIHIGLVGSDRVRVVIEGCVDEGSEAAATYENLRTGDEWHNMLVRPSEPEAANAYPVLTPIQLKAQKCIDDSIAACCGLQTVCEEWCGAKATISCTAPDGTPNDDGVGSCTLSCVHFGCEWDYCSLIWFWCACPDLAEA